MSETSFSPIVVDLFAGCGGLSEGFISAGFVSVAYLEKDKSACDTLRTRTLFHELRSQRKLDWYLRYAREQMSLDEMRKKFPGISDLMECRVLQKEFGKQSAIDILAAIHNAQKVQKAPSVHVLLGGPPCQAYSLVGRSRDPNRMEDDDRHYLYQHYLNVLEDLRPDFFVLENVPGLLTAKAEGEDIFHQILSDFASIKPAYEVAPSYAEYRQNPRGYLVDSSRFHVPQKRRRVLLLGFRRALAQEYPSVKEVFRKLRARETDTVLDVADAIGDLPPIRPGEGKDGWFGPYSQNESLKNYQAELRRYSPGICNHRARTHMESDLDRYKFFIEHHKNGETRATLEDLKRERPDLMPDHKHTDKFLDRFKVQWWNRPSATIMSHIAKDGHYYIHPDIHQCRSFSVREAARCQSFPDNFRFEGPRTEQFRQVGNAVPPRMAQAVAKVLRAELARIYDKR